MNIKEAEIKDFDVVYDFVQKLWDYNTYNPSTIKDVYQKILDDKASFLYILYDDDQAVGFCHGCVFPTFWLSGDTCYISSLYVDPTQRKKGYGKLLIDYVKKEMSSKNCQALILDSGFPRKDAHQFYEHYGFSKDCYGFEYSLSDKN